MNDMLKKYDYLSDVSDEIDNLIDQAKRERGREKKRTLLFQAQDLIDAYMDHVRAGGNTQKQFNFVI